MEFQLTKYKAINMNKVCVQYDKLQVGGPFRSQTNQIEQMLLVVYVPYQTL